MTLLGSCATNTIVNASARTASVPRTVALIRHRAGYAGARNGSWTASGENSAARPSIKPNALDCAAVMASAAVEGSRPLYASYRTIADAATMTSYAAIGSPMNGVTRPLPTAYRACSAKIARVSGHTHAMTWIARPVRIDADVTATSIAGAISKP